MKSGNLNFLEPSGSLQACNGTAWPYLLQKVRTIVHFTIYNGPTNALVCIKTLIQMSRTKTFKITPTCFDHQIIIIRELSDPG
jgi:hypothetical protein